MLIEHVWHYNNALDNQLTARAFFPPSKPAATMNDIAGEKITRIGEHVGTA
jgi:hypothetical protein